jgi:hypothetical protein
LEHVAAGVCDRGGVEVGIMLGVQTLAEAAAGDAEAAAGGVVIAEYQIGVRPANRTFIP